MDVTARLLRVFQVDRQLAGLEGRLHKAERFLGEQNRHLDEVGAQLKALQTQIRQLKASTANLENEVQGFDEHIGRLREQMNTAQTNKEYKALLAEVNTLKAERDRREEEAISLLTKIDELNTQSQNLESARGERDKMRAVAEGERTERASEIKERVEELKTKRETLAKEVPADVMAIYAGLVRQLDEEAMAPLEIADRRRHEYTCGACMMGIPMEMSISLLSGKLTRCPSCGCILFLTAEASDQITPAEKRS